MRIESGRWYSVKTGKCVQQVPKAKKRKNDPDEFRKPTLRDAVKDGEVIYYPSVTTIMQVKAKPGLLNWLISQAITAAATCPRAPSESDADWIKKVLSDADEERDAAATTGKDFHSAADTFWAYGTVAHEDPAIAKFLTTLQGWRTAMEAQGWGRWQSEQAYIDHIHEFAGTPDITAVKPDGSQLVADYKTCDFAKLKPDECPCYDEHAMQIGAGVFTLAPAHTHRAQHGVEIYIDRNTGDVRFYAWAPAEIKRGHEMFMTCDRLWKLVNKWDERKKVSIA